MNNKVANRHLDIVTALIIGMIAVVVAVIFIPDPSWKAYISVGIILTVAGVAAKIHRGQRQSDR